MRARKGHDLGEGLAALLDRRDVTRSQGYAARRGAVGDGLWGEMVRVGREMRDQGKGGSRGWARSEEARRGARRALHPRGSLHRDLGRKSIPGELRGRRDRGKRTGWGGLMARTVGRGLRVGENEARTLGDGRERDVGGCGVRVGEEVRPRKDVRLG